MVCCIFILHSISISLLSNFYSQNLVVYILFTWLMQGLFKWRDFVARVKDDSTGYVLPNKSILEIGKRNLCKYLYTFLSL